MKFELHYNGRKYPVVPAKVEDETPLCCSLPCPDALAAKKALDDALELDDANNPNR